MVDSFSPFLLIVEDNEFSRKIIATVLNGRRYLFAKNGTEAVAYYHNRRPDIVFLDIELPDINGHQVMKEIKKLNPEAYIVILSANGDRETILTCIKEGARGFIVKPFSKAKLDEYIERYIAETAFDRL